MSKPMVIFDLDGTLADITHRLPFIKGDTDKADYDNFNLACVHDEPKWEIINLLKTLHSSGKGIIIVTGRMGSDEVKRLTFQWLAHFHIPHQAVYFRPDKDYRSDVKIKQEILNKLIEAGATIEFVVDDREAVVQMWRDNGLTCLQCQRGDY